MQEIACESSAKIWLSLYLARTFRSCWHIIYADNALLLCQRMFSASYYKKSLISKGKPRKLHSLWINFYVYRQFCEIRTLWLWTRRGDPTSDHIRCRFTTDIKCTNLKEITWPTTSMACLIYVLSKTIILMERCFITTAGSRLKPDVLC